MARTDMASTHQTDKRWRCTDCLGRMLSAAARHGASNLRIYGSLARGEAETQIGLIIESLA